jgi:ubiquinone/menaquinone biosynthesis C-methylase UbiE
VLRIYGDTPAWEPDEAAVRRLVDLCGVPEPDARWLVANRTERHDATLPVLPPERTELHLRRYELACPMVDARRVLDAACGTGYGASLLMKQGKAASVVGVDIDAASIAYAQRRFAAPGIEFRQASALHTGLVDASIDVVTSFETIEHMDDPGALLREFSRVLRPGGRVVISTPNDWGLTAFHAQSFRPEAFRALVEGVFAPVRWLGQRAGDAPSLDGLPAGIFETDDRRWRAETLIFVGEKR